MDVVVCGAQMPFVRGGAELHQDNLVAALRAAGHTVDLVSLPVSWAHDALLDAPLAWRLLPVDAELVVATNFPSYFVRSDHKVVWLFHQHRAAFDAVDQPWSGFSLTEDDVELQRLLTEWDARALSEAHRVFTTSQRVADRLARFTGLTGTPLHHPPPLWERLAPGPSGDTVLLPTRHDASKRPHLLVDAVAAAGEGVRGVLPGRGPLTGDLRRRAADAGVADRLELPGFVDDDELVGLFGAALAVLYAPYDEDYGYVPLQAFRAGKPVVTTSDAGGVLEWVEHEVTGLVVEPTGAALGAAVARLRDDRELAERLGAAGREKVAGLSWEPVVDALVGALR